MSSLCEIKAAPRDLHNLRVLRSRKLGCSVEWAMPKAICYAAESCYAFTTQGTFQRSGFPMYILRIR
ncbi:hypothetical protein [Nostoc sp. T09]|uniref:hypothetical protein n=1 Tax=Nostoc sp. T09 TaxID=1932621 RepID=UPI001C501A77|nr:hypothetical protein [Nostoc sp. T09]